MSGFLPAAGAAIAQGIAGKLMGGEKTPRYYPYYKAMLGPEIAKNTTGAVMNGLIEKHMFNAKMESAKEHGIHPLAMLGVPSSSSSPVAMSSAPSSGAGFAMEGIGDMGRALAGQSNMEKLQERLILAQIEGQEIDNAQRAAHVALSTQAGKQFALPDDVVTVPKEVVANTGSLEKGQRAIGQKFTFMGRPIYSMSEDFANAGNDDGPLNWLSQMGIINQMLTTVADRVVRSTWRGGKSMGKQYNQFRK